MRAIVVRGGWEGHSPVEATDRFIPFLREHGYEVHATDDLDVYADAERMAAADLIVQCWSMGEITREQREGLDTAVRAGTGLAGWHGGIVDAFRTDLELEDLDLPQVRTIIERGLLWASRVGPAG